MKKKKTLQELVETYCNNPAAGIRNAIISEAIPLVRSIIGKINRPDHPLSQKEDLESAGIGGLLQALDTYDCSKSIQFNTFAYYRIRGSIIDYLRKIDQLPRNQRKYYGQIQKLIEIKSQQLGREPTDEEIASELDMKLENYYQLLSNVQQRNALSLDNPFEQGSAGSLYDIHADPNSSLPDRIFESKEKTRDLEQAIAGLKERDRLILTLYYYEELTMNEIALLLELSEARISQIIGKLLLQLKSTLLSEETTA